MNKKRILLIIFCLILTLLTSCKKSKIKSDNKDLDDEVVTYLDAPTNIIYNETNKMITWDKVNGAIGYEISYNGNITQTTSNELDILFLFGVDVNTEVSICALSENEVYNSNYSEPVDIILKSTPGLGYSYDKQLEAYGVDRGSYSFRNLPEIIVIPDYYKTYPVRKIAESGFTHGLVTNQATSIEELGQQSHVKKIRLPKELSIIEGYGFCNLGHLEQVNFPNTLKIIGDGAFSLCVNLKNINIPDSVEIIGYSCFARTAIESIYVSSIFKDSFDCFKNCKFLETVVFDDSITSIPYGFCSGCTNLKEVVFSSSLVDINAHAFTNCSSLEKIDLPNSLKKIDEFAFYGCSKLSEVNMPVLDYVSGCAFENTIWYSKFNGLVIHNSILLKITDIPENCDLVIPDSVRIISDHAFVGNSNLKSVYIPSTVKEIKVNAFSACKNLEKVEIDSGITVIPMYCFSNCSSLKEIILPNTIEKIEEYAFSGCNLLENINIPDSLLIVEGGAFDIKNMIKKFDLNNIEYFVNYQYIQLEVITLNKNIYFGPSPAYGYYSKCLKEIIIKQAVTKMPAFSKCPSLERIYYEGDEEHYLQIIDDYITDPSSKYSNITDVPVYFYSETEPINEGLYWHYVDDEIVIWD